jgi:transcriptional regulator with XRE-family HTH domain
MRSIKSPGKARASQVPPVGSFAARLHDIVNDFPTKAALARAAGVPPSSLESYLEGVEPTRPVLVNLATAADVSLEWLACGRGEKNPRPLVPDGYAQIPFYDVRSAGGYVYPLINEEVADFFLLKLRWFSYPGMRPSNLFVLEATETLTLEIKERDLIVVDSSWRTKFAQRYAKVPKGIYLVSSQAKLSVRQILGTSRDRAVPRKFS